MSYTLIFLFALTLNLFEIMDAAHICADLTSIGRVCVPDLASEINSDFQSRSISDCPIGKISVSGSCVNIEKAIEQVRVISDLGADMFKSMKENECPKGQIIKNGQCVNEGKSSDSFGDGVTVAPCPKDKHADKDGICQKYPDGSYYGGGFASAPCPEGTRADQHGNCRQQLY